MEIIQTHQLTQQQTADINALMEACRQSGNSLSFPFEDGTSFYLLYDPSLVCALALSLPEPEARNSGSFGECTAFTHPGFRRQGYFTALLDEAGEEFEDIDLLFPTDRACEDTLKTLEALGAEFDSEELRMDLEFGDPTFSDLPSRSAPRLFCTNDSDRKRAAESEPGQKEFFSTSDDSRDIGFQFFLISEESAAVPSLPYDAAENVAGPTVLDPRPESPAPIQAGVCRVFLCGGTDSACLHGFEIVPGLRRRGLGCEAISLVTGQLRRLGLRRLFLHVSGENVPAVNLYKKAGFRITETLAYYLY